MDIAASRSLQIFRSGTHTAVDGRALSFSASDLDAIASGYDPTVSEAPLVVGHPQLDAPAYGWAKGLAVKDGVLYATPDQVDPAFAEMVNSGRFNKISASFYMPDSPGNPKPGQYYLRHIGFLGAAAPAVKGLKSASFGEGAQVVTVEFAASDDSQALMGAWGPAVAKIFRNLRGYLSKNVGADLGGIMPDDALASLESSSAATVSAPNASFAAAHQENPMSDQQHADFAARETALQTQADELKRREQSLKQREEKARRDDVAEFAESLVKEGKILPRQKSGVVELMLVLPNDTAPLSFAEADGATVSRPAAQVMRDLLSSLPPQIQYGRERAGKVTDPSKNSPVNFAAPAGTTVNADRMELHNQALQYQSQHPNVSYIDAVRACGG